MWNLKNKTKQKPKLLETERRLVVAARADYDRDENLSCEMNKVHMYKMVNLVKNTVWYIWKLLSQESRS